MRARRRFRSDARVDLRMLPMKRARTSRRRYETFREAYREHRTDELSVAGESQDKTQPVDKAERRRYLANYRSWLWPHLAAIAVLLFLAVIGAGLDMVLLST